MKFFEEVLSKMVKFAGSARTMRSPFSGSRTVVSVAAMAQVWASDLKASNTF
jgi:hypothetical protein